MNWFTGLPQKNGVYVWRIDIPGRDKYLHGIMEVVSQNEAGVGWICDDGKVRISIDQNGNFTAQWGKGVEFLEIESYE